MQRVDFGAPWEFVHDVFGRVCWNTGNVYERWTGDPAGYVDGVKIELGAKTFAGRLNLCAAGNAQTSWPQLELDLGYRF